MPDDAQGLRARNNGTTLAITPSLRVENNTSDANADNSDLTTFQKLSNLVRMQCSPNPADDQVQLDLTQYKGKEVFVGLYNGFGQSVSEFHIETVGDSTFPMNLSDLTNGHYMIVVSVKGKRAVTKPLVIQR